MTFSDHSFGPLIQIKFNSTLKLRPESLRKLNNSLLSADLNKTRFNFLLQKWLCKRIRFENPLKRLDNLKLCLKFFFQIFGTLNSKFQNAKKLSVLERLTHSQPPKRKFTHCRTQTIGGNKERGAFVRSRSVSQVEDESPGKFFFKIERHQQQKTMINALRKDDSTTIIDPAEIKQEVAEHFKQRWNCTSTLSASSLEQNLADIPTITESYEYTPIDSLITKDEIKLAINSLNPNTSPGSDGVTPKFYQTFQTQLIPTLHQSYYITACSYNNKHPLLTNQPLSNLFGSPESPQIFETGDQFHFLTAITKLLLKLLRFVYCLS